MVVVPDLDQIRPGLLIWHAYDATVKADLFSTAIAIKSGVFLVDPIQLADAPLAQLAELGPIAGVIVTNANHFRAAPDYTKHFSVPLYAHRKSSPNEPSPEFVEVADGLRIGGELEAAVVEGAPPGEIALYHEDDGGTLVIGDALINFDPYGFILLPEKYCENAKQMRKSLRKLLYHNVERILFAHGMPILSGAHVRLRQLLDVDL